jgi:hypothetical protein
VRGRMVVRRAGRDGGNRRGGLGEEERKRKESEWVRLACGPHYRVLAFENEIGL